MMTLAQELTSPESRLHRVVLSIDMKDAPILIDQETEAACLATIGRFLDVALRSSESEAREAVRFCFSRVRIVFSEDDALAAVNAAIRIQEALNEPADQEHLPMRISIGIAAGEITRVSLPGSGVDYIGSVIDRASGLASAAAPGAVFVDRNMQALLRNGGFSSRAGESQTPRRTADEYEGPEGKVKLSRFADEVEYREILWNTTLYGLAAAPPPTAAVTTAEPHDASGAAIMEGATIERCLGSVRRWSRDRGQGLIVSNQGEFFYVDRRYVVGATPLEPGSRVYFIPRPSLIPGKNRVAACVVALDAVLMGTVVRVGSRGFGFLEVSDSSGASQRLFMLLGDSHERFTVSDTVSFVVAENDRGPIARNPRRAEPAYKTRHAAPHNRPRRPQPQTTESESPTEIP